MSLSSTDALLRQQTPLLFNQLHWLRVCGTLFNAPQFLDLLFQQKGKRKEHYANAISAAK